MCDFSLCYWSINRKLGCCACLPNLYTLNSSTKCTTYQISAYLKTKVLKETKKESSLTLLRQETMWLRSIQGVPASVTWWNRWSRKSFNRYRSPVSDHVGSFWNLIGTTQDYAVVTEINHTLWCNVQQVVLTLDVHLWCPAWPAGERVGHFAPPAEKTKQNRGANFICLHQKFSFFFQLKEATLKATPEEKNTLPLVAIAGSKIPHSLPTCSECCFKLYFHSCSCKQSTDVKCNEYGPNERGFKFDGWGREINK